MKVDDFFERAFQAPKAIHDEVRLLSVEEAKSLCDLDSKQFGWEFFGLEKFGRYAFCKKCNIKRKLTMGEFYGSSPVD